MRASCRNRVAVVTPRGAVYHSRMSGSATIAPRVERRTEANGDAELVVHGARAVEHVALRPSLFRELHRPFALGAGERLAARVLLALLRLPGGAKLLRAWHARRGA
jgi:hypothetical protein